MAALLETLELGVTAAAAKYSIIWLHGMGANAEDLAPLIDEFRLLATKPIRHVLPTAPTRAITVNRGAMMPSWFDIEHFNDISGCNLTDIEESIAMIQALMRRELEYGIPYDNILLAGFSQGGTIALHTVAKQQQTLGGVIALSTLLPFSELFIQRFNAAGHQLPIFLAHGTFDEVLPFQLGNQLHQVLSEINTDTSWHTYPTGHNIVAQEIQDLQHWLQRILAF